MSKFYEKYGLKRFDVRNHDLAVLSAEVAIDLRNYVSNRRKDEDCIQYLSKLIYESTEGEKRAMEHGNNSVLSYAISGRENYDKYWKGKEDEEVVLQARLISEELKNFKNLPKEKLEELIEFCIRLSKEVSIYFDFCYPYVCRGPYFI